ncbi:MAG: DUF5683 domain-containing protein [candidate division WOR-3 bacterium]
MKNPVLKPLLLTLAVTTAVTLTVAQEPSPASPDTLTYPQKSPSKAVLLSLLFPGGGQLYTRSFWKAAIIAPTEIALAGITCRYHNLCQKSLAQGDTAAYQRLSERRTTFLWWTGAIIAFSMADAYVSAQMFGFDEQMRLSLGPGRAGIELPF